MLASLHTPTLAMSAALVLTCIAVLGFYFLWKGKTYPGFAIWCYGLTALAVGFTLLTLRGTVPAWASVVMGNYLLALGLCLPYDGIIRFESRPARYPFDPANHGVAVFCIAGLSYYLYADNQFGMRVIWISGFQLFMSARIWWLTSQVAKGRNRSTYGVLTMIFMVDGALAAGRIVHTMAQTTSAQSLHSDIGFRIVALVNIVLALALGCCLLMLTHNRITEELDKARSEAELASRTDRLTGLWNRHHFEAEAWREMQRAMRYGQAASLLLIDADRFKSINDHHGHLVGDEVLKELAKQAGDCLRASDLLCRWGGEELVVLVPEGISDAFAIAEKLRQTIENGSFSTIGKISISIGVAELQATDDLSSWIQRADEALYRAKENGRNRVEAADLAPA